MRNALAALLLTATIPLHAADRELELARAMTEDAIVRNDVTGMQLARGRLLNIIAEADDRTVLRDANELVALSSLFESISGWVDTGTGAKAVATGIRHADRAIEIDPQFADAWMIAAMLRSTAPRFGVAVAPDPPGTQNRMAHAVELDPKSPSVAFFSAMLHSFNPAGPAPAAAVRQIDDLVAQLDANRAVTHRRFGVWDAEAHAWQVMVRFASAEPDATIMRPMVARLVDARPDFAIGQELAEFVAERRFVAPPDVAWQPFLTDPAGDGKDPKLPDVVSVDRAEDGDRMWYRVTVRDPLPRSFGVNIVVNRTGDPSTGARWWGGTPFRFDRLVTAWISRDGDRYFGRIGVSDDDGLRGFRLAKITPDVQLAMSADNRVVFLGVPKSALGLTDKSVVIVAVGSHLVWNDDATSH